MQLNKFIGAGNLATDPEVRATQGGTSMCRVRAAFSSGYGDKKKTAWVTLVFFGKNADAVGENFHKGSNIYVEGELEIEEYDKKDGSGKATSVSIVCDRWRYAEAKSKAAEAQADAAAPRRQAAPKREEKTDYGDIPF